MKNKKLNLSACKACGTLAPLGNREWCQRCINSATPGTCAVCKETWDSFPKKDYGACNKKEYEAFLEDPIFLCNVCLDRMQCCKCLSGGENILFLCDGEGCRAKDRGYSKAVCFACSGEEEEPEHYFCQECREMNVDDALIGQKWREKARLKGQIAVTDATLKRGEEAFIQDSFAQVEADIQSMRNTLVEKLKNNDYLVTSEAVVAVNMFSTAMKNAVPKKRERQEKTEELVKLKKRRAELEQQLERVQEFLQQEKKKTK